MNISVIVPVYNMEKYLNRCIKSVLNQTFQDFELILVDDGSKDKSGTICDEWKEKDGRVSVIHQENAGVSAARNRGIKKARGQWICFVDADDWIMPEYLSYMVSLQEKNNADLVVVDTFRSSSEDYPLQGEEKLENYGQEEYVKKICKIGTQVDYEYPVGKLFKREVIENIRFPKLSIAEDVPFNYQVALKVNRITESNWKGYCYFLNSESVTGKGGFSSKRFDLLTSWNIICHYAKETKNKVYYQWAIINRYRADFGLLFVMASSKDFFETKKRYAKEVDRCIADLKKHKNILLKSRIPISRKVLIELFTISYNFFGSIIYCIKKFV